MRAADDAEDLSAPEVIAGEIVEDLIAALTEFEAVTAALEAGANAVPEFSNMCDSMPPSLHRHRFSDRF